MFGIHPLDKQRFSSRSSRGRSLLFVLLFLGMALPPLASVGQAQEGEPPSTLQETTGPRQPEHLSQRLVDPQLMGPGWLAGEPLSGELHTPLAPEAVPDSATAVTLGLSHTCALTDVGGVRCWGDNYLGQLGNGTTITRYVPVDVLGLVSGITQVDSLHKHSCALTAQGGLKCWGYNFHGELGDGSTTNRLVPVFANGLTGGVAEIAVGGFHTCALMVWGGVKCWGANWHGQVGDGTTLTRLTPVDVDGLDSGVLAITAGKFHSCALMSSRRVKCWGYNRHGELGDGFSNDRHTPIGVWGITGGVAEVRAGSLHTCARFQDERVKCWGDNLEGQLGDGTTVEKHTPVSIFNSGSGVTALALGGFHSCARFESGGLKCWGDNWAGQVGDGTNDDRLGPANVPALQSGVASLAGGDSHTCAVLLDGRIWCWGSNSFGQLGDTTGALRLAPVQVAGLGGSLGSITAGELHACALTASGGVQCWGNNKYGQLGDGTYTDRLAPAGVSGLSSGVVALAAGGYHTCAVVTGGSVKCWGDNAKGQLGDGSGVGSPVPVDVVTLTGVIDLALGLEHSCALLNTSVFCWGSNWAGQIGDGTNERRWIPVAVTGLPAGITSLEAGFDHTCAVTGGGALKCWGYNFNGQLGDGTSVNRWSPTTVTGLSSGVNGVGAGAFHTCALLNGGALNCWGGNFSGQVGDGTSESRFTPVSVSGLSGGVSQVAAGSYHTCALLDNGDVQCWGDNWSGQIGDGSTLPRVAPQTVNGLSGPVTGLAAGAHFTCGRTGNGARCWGAHGNGQIGDGSLPWRQNPADVIGLIPALLSVNYSAGQPGSSFTLSGVNFLPGGMAAVTVNGLVLAQAVPINSQGEITLLLATAQADPGDYFVSVAATLEGRTQLVLDPAAPLRPPEGSGYLVDIPPGIGFGHRAHLAVAAQGVP